MSGRILSYGDTTGDLNIHCDAVVIGSGAGGAAAAAELAEGGLDVVCLEEGPLLTQADLRGDLTDVLTTAMRFAGTTATIGRAPVTYFEGRCVGGTTVFNGGMCWRTPPKALQRWRFEHGLRDFSPSRLEAIFAHVEERVNAREQDPGSEGNNNQVFKDGCDRLGYKVSRNRRNQVHCVGASDCVTGCPTGGKQSTRWTYVPALLRHGGQLYINCKAEKILTERGAAVGVSGRLENPETGQLDRRFTVRAAVTVVAGGAIQTPLLLLRNKLCRGNRQVGRNFTIHPNVKVTALFDRSIRLDRGAHQAWQCHEFLDEGILMAPGGVAPAFAAVGFDAFGAEHARIMEDYHLLAAGGVLVDDHASGRVSLGPLGIPLVRYNVTDVDQDKFIRAVSLLAEIYFEAGAKRVFLPFHGAPPLDSIDDIPRMFRSKPRVEDTEYFTAHLMGTCRMDADPARGVVGPSGETHEVKGLFVADASVMPTPIGVNPQETIMALATWTARHIIENRARSVGRNAA
jgi:choline dehydrogenase-like flavoprotein